MDSSTSAPSTWDPYRELFERSADAILIIEGETFTDCNDATVRMLHYRSKEEVLQTHPSELSPARQPDGRDSFEKANEMIAMAFARGSHRFEWDHKRADGEVFPVEVLLTAVQEPGRRVLHVVWRDITQRRLLEDQLRQALKMDAMGKLTGGIAHDFNNLLVAVLGHADLLTEGLPQHSELHEHVNEIRGAGERAAELVRQLLAFARKQQFLPTVLDLNTLVRDAQRLLERLIGEDVELVPRLHDGQVRVKADRSQMEQVLLNLATNARDAMPDGGRLTIQTGLVSQPQAAGDLELDLPGGDYAQLLVTDTGRGMDAATSGQAFDPFFTTKPAGKGTGLGLATVYGIVRQSGGAVSLLTSPGHGATVKILLPLSAESVSQGERAVDAPAEEDGEDKRILIVEDDFAVSKLVVRTLEGRGHRVLTARDGREALSIYVAQHGEIDLLVTDVIMPNMSGPRLVRELERLGFTPPVLFMSGYTNESLAKLQGTGRAYDLLEKPFAVQELVRRVQGALRDRRGRFAVD